MSDGDEAAPDGMIRIRELRRLLDPEMLHRVLSQGRHHHDERGEAWWVPDELDEAIALAEIELASDRGDDERSHKP
jgi:hypothetical protein